MSRNSDLLAAALEMGNLVIATVPAPPLKAKPAADPLAKPAARADLNGFCDKLDSGRAEDAHAFDYWLSDQLDKIWAAIRELQEGAAHV